MKERRAASAAEIAALQRQLAEAFMQGQTQEALHQAKKDNIRRCAEDQMDEADGEAGSEALGLEFTAAGLGFGGATPGDKAREWLNKP